MLKSSHARLAQILRDIEGRCANYKRHPLSEAQKWTDENWSLGTNPLIDVVKAGVTYCQLNGMDQHIGFELNQLGARVCGLSDTHLTERIAGVELFDAVAELREFARRVRSEIEWYSADDNYVLHDEAKCNGQAVTNNSDAALDGPVEGYRWCHNGDVTCGAMQPKAWKMANFLWTKRSHTAYFDDLAQPVYEEHSHPITESAIGSLRKQANSFFAMHSIPLLVSIKQGTVSLEIPSAVERSQSAQ